MEQQKQGRIPKGEEQLPLIVDGAGNYMPNAVRSSVKRSSEETKAKLRQLMEEESKMVKGRFLYHECSGGTLPFIQRKYKDLPVFQGNFVDGREYTVPLWVARWLNGIDKASAAYGGVIHSGAWPIYKHETVTEWGQVQHLQPIGSHKRRYSFQSMDFIT